MTHGHAGGGVERKGKENAIPIKPCGFSVPNPFPQQNEKRKKGEERNKESEETKITVSPHSVCNG